MSDGMQARGAGGAEIPRVYAHTREGEGEESWEPILDHLADTAERAGEFANAFGARAWGELAGWWHDLGKYLPEFQARLRGASAAVEHAGVGAALAAEHRAWALAFAIAGHHAGLANREVAAEGAGGPSPLSSRLVDNRGALDRVRTSAPADLLQRAVPPLPPAFQIAPSAKRTERERLQRRAELWTRFLFSALVDADYLATEAFLEPERRAPAREFDSIPTLRDRLDAHTGGFVADTPVNTLRAGVLADCHAAAELSPGIFSLTVPTGGGKTLSGMAFALHHAARYELRRVVVAIPYTSIIEQNARVYAKVLGGRNVIEHHSGIDEDAAFQNDPDQEMRRRLASENWDAPVVVTTNVQLLESLFANGPARCRKLHNLARSVIILDEAQTLPPQYLDCLLDALRDLVELYGCTVVLSTATQPALVRRESLPTGLDHVQEIVRERDALFHGLERVRIHWPTSPEPTPYEEIAGALKRHDQVLAIVHLRRDARTLAKLLPPDNLFHLSALMCAAHRAEILQDVRRRLKDDLPCRLIATQLVEAGVDIDFPVVYRAMAGLDSLAQAAGRCNREGKLERGDFVVFHAETNPPPGILSKGMETARGLLQRYGMDLGFTRTQQLEEYFRALYAKCERDQRGVQSERRQFNFANVAHRVRLIEDGFRHPVVVLWGEAEERLARYRKHPCRTTLRALQPYTVQIAEPDLKKLLGDGALEIVAETVHALTPAYHTLYDPTFGFGVAAEAMPDPEALMG
jgi:CRISPR-associated endonuclease/helicase Cas3